MAMELIMVRHGKAESFGHPGGDAERALVERGWRQARRAGELLKATGFLPRLVLTSPLVRARETAEALCEAAGLPGPVVQGWLACGMHPEAAIEELVAFADFERVAIVGHEPDLSGLAALLLGAAGGVVEMKKGAVAAFRLAPPGHHGELLFLLPPRLNGCGGFAS